MDSNTAVREFEHSSDQKLGATYMIDSFVTGKQELFGLGERFTIGRRRGEHNLYNPRPDRKDLLPIADVCYIALRQGAYATNQPIITTNPIIRDRVCGSALVRCEKPKGKGPGNSDISMTGSVSAMMHFADLQSLHADNALGFLCYADSVDALIDAGWTVVKEADFAIIKEDLDSVEVKEKADGDSGSPSKKQRRV
ncbi:uncharacterized protein E0L32_008430 [Thyridium curvatum]|uniref:Uncharacterized protein n=1 Tax=Thyridium curvatum TaxID=1093900 RepID=A0A507AVG4_9PEZI|nr:uncharacterized protein E0L32_008430 [Thyridium curvatum]TPX10696.1 hypothetical protein E0L32_008430 [Thyridium curvatum]